MIMAPAGGFSVTPGHFNAQYEYEFRQKKERVTYAEVRSLISPHSFPLKEEKKTIKSQINQCNPFNFQVEANRRRIKRWLTDPNASFTQP